MKTTKLLTALLLSVLLFSCSKDETFPANPYAGHYTGTVTINLPQEGIHETKYNEAIVLNVIDNGYIAIRNLGLSYYANAKLDGTTYTYVPFGAGGTSAAGVTSYGVYNGMGTFKGDSLIESGIITLAFNGVVQHGSWFTRMKKKQ